VLGLKFKEGGRRQRAWIFLYESSNYAQVKLDIDDEQIGGSIHSFKETTKINKQTT
jgi:hypothetical protein